jgi:UDP-N-acetyl-D-glucosamine dehydrogenase
MSAFRSQEAVRVGLNVTGLDSNKTIVDGLMAGRSHVDDLSDADVAMVDAGFRATTNPSCIRETDVVVICLPTPQSEDGGPDLSVITTAAATVADHLTPGTLVILESTTYPGTTGDVLRPRLEETGLRLGEDFNLAYSPERIDPGNTAYGFRNTPKIVGGITPTCTGLAVEFYARLVDEVVVARGVREAETAKLLENTYRHVTIALVNEMAKFCHELDIDLWDVIRCASSKPFGFQTFYSGPGVGGHCIPIDPNYPSYTVRVNLGNPFRFVELAHEINHNMPAYVVGRAQDLLNSVSQPLRGSQLLLLGVTYKADIADERESPAVPLAKQLLDGGAEVSFHDPLVPRWTLGDTDLARVEDLDEALASAGLVLLLQRHTCYRPRPCRQAGYTPSGHEGRGSRGPDRGAAVSTTAGAPWRTSRPRSSVRPRVCGEPLIGAGLPPVLNRRTPRTDGGGGTAPPQWKR